MIIIVVGAVALVAIDQWWRHLCRKQDAIDAKEDNSLAGAMERSRRYWRNQF